MLQGAAAGGRHGALQLLGFELGPPEQLEGLAGVDGRARMAGAGDRQAPLAAVAVVGRATADKHAGLERFEG